MSDDGVLHLAEVPYEDGRLRFRYARKLAPSGDRWIRHGRFEAYHPNGQLASEGEYVEGAEQGLWRDYHENSQLAAEGRFEQGVESGEWRYWSSDGQLERTEAHS